MSNVDLDYGLAFDAVFLIGGFDPDKWGAKKQVGGGFGVNKETSTKK